MINNKRAMSAVVTTVLLVALAIGAVAILWAVLSGTITQQTDSMGEGVDCIDAAVSVSDYNCNNSNSCNVTVKRSSAGEGEIDAVRIQASDGSNSTVSEKTGNIVSGGTKTYGDVDFSELSENVTSMKAGARIGDKDCPLA